jgi:hypothetical protein
MRLTERHVLALLLKELDLPYGFIQLDTTGPVISLCLFPAEWDEVQELVNDVPLDAMAEAWRELPSEVWMDESWIRRVCVRVCAYAPDYSRLILGKTG